MKEKILIAARVAALAIATLFASALPSMAQVVSAQPQVVLANTVLDLGSGPLELRIQQGSAFLFTNQGNNGSLNSADAGTTTLTLTNTPTTPPCVGCIISGSGITSGTTVAAYNGTTGITLSAAMTIPANTLIQWGATCPTSPTGFPGVTAQAGVGYDIPIYSQAHICAAGLAGPGAQLFPFPIGAH